MVAIGVAAGSISVGMAQQSNQVIAWQADKAPRIDGDLSDWKLDTPGVIERKDQVIKNGSYWDGPDDNSACFYLMWDERNLYLGAKIVDDVPFTRFMGFRLDGIDAVAVYLSTDPASDPARTIYAPTDFRILLAIDNDVFDTGIDRDMVISKKGIDTCGMDGYEAVLEGYEIAVKPDALGYTLETKLPFSCLANDRLPALRPRPGLQVGFSLELIDLDQACPGAEASWLSWTGRPSLESPQNWGTLRFEGK